MSPFYLFRATQHRNTLPTIWFRANADFGDKVLLRLENKVCSRLLIATPLSHTCGSRLDGVPGGFYPTSNVRIRFRNRNLYTRHSIKYTIILYCIVTILSILSDVVFSSTCPLSTQIQSKPCIDVISFLPSSLKLNR